MSAHQVDVKTRHFTVSVVEMAGGMVVRVKRNDGLSSHLLECSADEGDNVDVGVSGDFVEAYFT
jgi:hypothetical protein